LVIRRNVVFENECDIPFSPHGHKTPTDGNGIIMDDFYNTQGGGQEGGYQSDVLIENNLSFNNGGRGIHVYKSDNILIRNNTTFHNMRVLSKYGSDPAEINVDESFGTQVINNIMVKNPELKNPALRFWKNDVETTKVMNNVVVGEKNFCGQKLFEKDNIYREADDQSFPNFKNPTVDVEFDSIDDFEAYFSLARRSPAINAATKANAAEVDLTGKKRPRRRVDAGCYER
ncbi:MAG: choice-of-anchor Q domain-containing protein, partial [Planctomycetota bacterium]